MFVCRHVWSSGPEAGKRCTLGPRMEDGFCVFHSQLDEERPWKAAKDPANLPRVGEVLSWCVETLRLAGLALTPVMPDACARLRASVGVAGPVDFEKESAWGFLATGTKLGEPPNLFPRIDAASIPSA